MPKPNELALRPEPELDPLDALNERERAFVEAYVGHAQWNATKAALSAGYGSSEGSASVLGYRLLNKVHIKEAIRYMTRGRAMDAEELLLRLGAEARLDLSEFPEVYKTEEIKDADGKIVTSRRLIDWPEVKRRGLGPFIKAVKQTRYGESLELIDTQRAKEMIGRALGLFADRLRVEGQIDYSKLTDDELKQLAAGKRPSTL